MKNGVTSVLPLGERYFAIEASMMRYKYYGLIDGIHMIWEMCLNPLKVQSGFAVIGV